MKDQEKRIKLADAMKIEYWRSEVYGDALGLPDPFTDANDDYAVLEHYRHKWSFNVDLNEKQLGSYEIGDYARAALKVLE